MNGMTEEEYVAKFRMLIILDREKLAEIRQYSENMKYIMESYSLLLKEHPGLILSDERTGTGETGREIVQKLSQICRSRMVNSYMSMSIREQDEMFGIFVEAIYRSLLLMRVYVDDGPLLADVIYEIYCSSGRRSEIQMVDDLYVSRATFYRRKKKALMYMGYFFYEVVLPEMEGRI